MKLSRSFTKVYTKPRKPLSQTLERFFAKVENVVVEDVRFALMGDEPKTEASADSDEKKDKNK
jgi:hypothetical protein